MQVVCGIFRKITTVLLNSNEVCNGDISHDVLGEVLESRITNYLMAYFRKKTVVFSHPVTIYQLLRIKCITVVEGTIFIMSLDLDAVVGHGLKQVV